MAVTEKTAVKQKIDEKILEEIVEKKLSLPAGSTTREIAASIVNRTTGESSYKHGNGRCFSDSGDLQGYESSKRQWAQKRAELVAETEIAVKAYLEKRYGKMRRDPVSDALYYALEDNPLNPTLRAKNVNGDIHIFK